jgi:ATP-dependent DNA helicase RecQ
VYDLLQGQRTAEVKRLGLESLSTFGLLSDYSREHLEVLSERLMERGMLLCSGESVPVFALTQRSKALLFQGQRLTIRRKAPKRISAPQSGAAVDPVLFAQLKELRLKLAKRQGVPAFVVFSDATLREICAHKPTSLKAFSSISGVGSVKCQRYGKDFTALVRSYSGETNRPRKKVQS